MNHAWETAEDFVEYLKERLIPDLRESGSEYTAQDFEDACEFIEQLLDQRNGALKALAPDSKTVAFTRIVSARRILEGLK